MTKQKLVIKVSMDGSDKTRSKALRIVVGIYGVQSAAVGEKDKNELEVIGEGIDPVKVTTSLRKRLAKWPFLTCLLPNTMVYAELSYVVYLGAHSDGQELTSIDQNLVSDSHYDFLGSFLGSREFAQDAIFYSYTRNINGFAATIEDEVAAQIAKHPKVVSVFLNTGKKLHTTHSWSFLGLEQNGVVPSNSIWKKARYGEDIIIGNLDTGVWPESKSFSDEGLGPIPSKWKGICQNGSDPGFTAIAFQLALPCCKAWDCRDCSAGNSGPDEATVSNLAPWQITVGASTQDREFPSYVTLGNNIIYKGESLSAMALPKNKFFPIISAADARTANASVEDALLCEAGTLDPKKAKGKILVCLRGVNARVDKGEQASLAGAVGMVLANDKDSGNEILADPHVLPASHVNYTIGVAIFAYINSTKSPIAHITPPITQIGTKPAPFMAAFSSKGPNTIAPDILKPDITAPGVSIIAAYTEAEGPTNEDFDTRRVLFNSISGTSMSCPHVSGVAGLLRTLYPNWSPAAIKSAIMTSGE
ncbi:hypothetical protein GH714_023684 [Hevea brasiliensis]|uniref:Peptidase S8/S53 domain-containing protein n=1 Tax=Hevea brasiliensis TaxID=3981 RepID=A0A6A6KJ81_HEVBR|nr:hypothetical protein GH714_023684 [Hevea brasiliensis]